MKKHTAVFLLILGFSSSINWHDAQAAELVLNGLAVHQELRKDYFIAGLYLPSTSSKTKDIFKMKGPKRMEMRITLDRLSPRKFAGLWRESLVVNNSPDDIEKFGQDMIRFSTALKGKLVTGDHVQIEYQPRDATVLLINSAEIARFSGDFFPLLLRTWIGPRPNATSFKKGLLKTSSIETLESRYDSIQPLDGRKQVASAWASGTAVASAGNAEAEARAAAEAKQRAEEEAQRQAEEKAARIAAQQRAEAKKRAEAEALAKRQAEEKARALAKVQAAEEAKARVEAEVAAQEAETARLLALQSNANTKAKKAAEAKALAAAQAAKEAKARAEAQAKVKARAEAKALAAANAKAEAKQRAAAEEKTRLAAEAKAKAEAEARAIAQAKSEADAKQAAENAAVLAAVQPGGDTVDEEDAIVELTAEQISSELYQSKLVAWVYKYLEYPEKDKRRRNEGSIRAVVKITRAGKWINTDLTEKSRYASLDFAAKKAIQTAQPYPAIPDDINGDEFEFTVPILFRSER